MLRLPQPDSRFLKQEAKAGVGEPPVPRDRLLNARFRFPEIGRAEMARAVDTAHLLSEAVYAGVGRWDRRGEFPSLVRDCAFRVTGYVSAYGALGLPVHRDRAAEGLDLLLTLQHSDGDFPSFDFSQNGVRGTSDALMETAAAGLALLEGYRLTRDERLLDASHRVARAEMGPYVGETVTSWMTAAAHLAAHSEAVSDERALAAAIDLACSRVTPTQLPSGGWAGVDSWMWNHGHITRGLARLVRAVPLSEPRRAELMPALVAALNRMLREQAAIGDVPPNPRVRLRGYASGEAILAMLAAREVTNPILDASLRGAMGYWLSKLPDGPSVDSYASAWQDYVNERRASISAATGDVPWRADFSRFVRDVEWGEVVVGAINCWPKGLAFDPSHQRWSRVASERTGGNAQRITSRGAALVGGMGWEIPAGVLVPGRRYRFRACASCEGDVASMPILVCSAVAGRRASDWDPLLGAELTRESPTFGSYSAIHTTFVASRESHRVCVWAGGEPIGADDAVSITVDEAWVEDAGRALPVWGQSLDAFERERGMIILPAAEYLGSLTVG